MMDNMERTVFVNTDKNMMGGGSAPISGGSELDRAYLELGKAYYEGGFEDPLPQLLPLFNKITMLKNQPKTMKNVCPQCGKELIPNARFCGKCGCQL